MLSEVVSNLMLFALEAINLWAVFNSAVLWNFLRKRRRLSRMAQGVFETNAAMGMNAASWGLILLSAILWPQTTRDSTAPLWVQIATTVAFFSTSIGIAYALHRQRALIMGTPDPPEV